MMSFVSALAVNVSHILLCHGLLLNDLGKLRLELWWDDCALVVEILETFHDLIGECFLSKVRILLMFATCSIVRTFFIL